LKNCEFILFSKREYFEENIQRDQKGKKRESISRKEDIEIFSRVKMNSYGRQKSIQLNKAVKLITRTNTKESVPPPVWQTAQDIPECSGPLQRSRSKLLENLPPKKMLVKGLGTSSSSVVNTTWNLNVRASQEDLSSNKMSWSSMTNAKTADSSMAWNDKENGFTV